MHGRTLPPLRSLLRHASEHLLWSSHRGQHALWDIAADRLVEAREGDEGTLVLGAGGRWLITATDGALVVRDHGSGAVVHSEPVAHLSAAVLRECDAADAIVAGDPYGSVVRVEYDTWKVVHGQLAAPETRAAAAPRDPDDKEHVPPTSEPVVKIGRLLRAGARDMLSWRTDLGCLEWTDIADPAAAPRRVAEMPNAKVDLAALDPGGNRVVLACNDGTFAVAELPGGAIRRERLRGAEAVTARVIGSYPPVRQLAWAGAHELWWLTPGWLYHADLLAQRTRGLRLQSSALCIAPLPERGACAVGSMDGALRIVALADMPVVHGA